MFKMTFLVLHRQRRYRTCYLQCDVILEAVKTNTYINTFCSIPMFTFSTYKLKHLSVNHFLAERKTQILDYIKINVQFQQGLSGNLSFFFKF